MIAINDDYADGRDVSWLYDVSFESLRDHGVALTSGVRGWDMALRLQYDDVPVGERSATALALIMHEQATNAMKYGGLSTEAGMVSLTGQWWLDDRTLDKQAVSAHLPPPPPASGCHPTERREIRSSPCLPSSKLCFLLRG